MIKSHSAFYGFAGLALILGVSPVLAQTGVPPAESIGSLPSAMTPSRDRDTDFVTLNLRDVPIRDALDALFKNRPTLRYTLHSIVQAKPAYKKLPTARGAYL